MITKQQKFIEDNDFVGNSTHEKSKFFYTLFMWYVDLELFLDEAENDMIDDQDGEYNEDSNQINTDHDEVI